MENMEIEKKYLIDKDMLPPDYKSHAFHKIEQGYLNTRPVVRIRKQDDNYYLTYKGNGLMAREEYNLPLDADSYNHLLPKCDGNIISKTRYNIPFNNYKIELDIFEGEYKGLVLAEVEFATEEDAISYAPPEWFGEDVSERAEFCNSYLSAHCCRDITF